MSYWKSKSRETKEQEEEKEKVVKEEQSKKTMDESQAMEEAMVAMGIDPSLLSTVSTASSASVKVGSTKVEESQTASLKGTRRNSGKGGL